MENEAKVGYTNKKLELRVLQTQEAYPKHLQGQIRVYGLSIDFTIPTESISVSQLISDILENFRDPILVSPKGEIAKSRYAKPVSTLRPDKLEYTSQDNIRAYLLRSSEFIQELENSGWFYFPGFEELDKEGKKELGLSEFTKAFSRSISLSKLVNAIRSSERFDKEDPEDNQRIVRDLVELLPFCDEARYIHEPVMEEAPPEGFFSLTAKYKNEAFKLNLERLNDSIFKTQYSREKPNTLRRKTFVRNNFSLVDNNSIAPDWWKESESKRIEQLAREYLEEKQIKHAGVSVENQGINVFIYNRGLNSQELNPDTKKLLEQAYLIKDFTRKAIEHEYEQREREETIKLVAARSSLGLSG